MPIAAIDLDGLEELIVVRWYDQDKYTGQSYIYVTPEERVVATGYLYVQADVNNAAQIDQLQQRRYEHPEYTKFKDAVFDKDATTGNYQLKPDALYSQSGRNKIERDRKTQFEKNYNDMKAGRTNIMSITRDKPARLTIGFDYDDSDPLKFRAINEDYINGFKRKLSENPDFNLIIEGHTSSENSTGKPNYNQGLSLDRANAVKNFLVQKGIDASRIDVVGRESSMPVGDNNTDAGRSANRRAEMSDHVPKR